MIGKSFIEFGQLINSIISNKSLANEKNQIWTIDSNQL
jgi:hypothetical protein